MSNAKEKQPFFTATRMAVIAIFSALSGVLYAFGVAIPVLFAPWLELKFCDVPLLIGTFSLGVPSGAIVLVCRTLIKLLFKPTSTMYVGELGDILLGLALIIPAGLIYGRKKTLKGAIFACVTGSACLVVGAMIFNRFVLIPLYMKTFHWDLSVLAGMVSALYKNCTAETFYSFYLWLSVLPFNALQCTLNALLTFAVYKKVSYLIKRAEEKFGKKSPKTAKKSAQTEEDSAENKHKQAKQEEKNGGGSEKQA